MTKQIFSDVQNYGYLLIICKKEHLKYKMPKTSCHRQLAYQILTHICKLIKFENDQSSKTEKYHENLFQPNIFLKKNKMKETKLPISLRVLTSNTRRNK